jgi:hypothetical protein
MVQDNTQHRDEAQQIERFNARRLTGVWQHGAQHSHWNCERWRCWPPPVKGPLTERLKLGSRNPFSKQRIPVGSDGVDLQTATHMLHCRIAYDDINLKPVMRLKAGDRAKLPLCSVWNGSNKISL